MIQQSTDVAVIGAGPAGMMCALKAAEKGLNTVIIDPNRLCGRKLRITGKGRCNVTNNCDANEFLKNICREGKFLRSALQKFGPADTISFFEALNVPLKTERGNRVFPVSDNANDIADALVSELQRKKCRVIRDRVTDIITENGEITSVALADGGKLACKAVVIASGGMSYPKTGSDGYGYKLAARFGHTVVPPRPALVPVVCEGNFFEELQGLSLRNVDLSLFKDGKCIRKERGELLFTHFGLSGPLVLSASSLMDASAGAEYSFAIDLKPALDEETLDKRILRDFELFKNKELKNSLGKLMPLSLVPVVIEKSGIAPDTPVNSVTREERRRLLSVIKGFDLNITGLRPIDEAIVTAGGVNVKEVNPRTMESKLQKHLYFAGEVLNIDGFTGGFNLQVAWTTGFVAGSSVETEE